MASQGITDLMTALQGFNNGLKSLQTSRVLNNANEAVEQIRASDADAQQKKAQIRGIADQLTMKLVGLGGSAEEAAKIAATFSPQDQWALKNIQNPFQLRLYGEATGDEKAITLSDRIIQEEQQRDLDKEMARDKRQEKALDASIARMEAGQSFKEKVRSQERTVNDLGTFSTVGDAKRIRKEIPMAKTAIEGVRELMEFTQLDKLDPKQIKRATTLAQSIKGASRLSLIGPGAMSDQENAILDKIITNPTDLLQIPGTEKASLETLESRLLSAARNNLDFAIEDYNKEGEFYRFFYGDTENKKTMSDETAPGKSRLDKYLR